jgi:hypothetical protein
MFKVLEAQAIIDRSSIVLVATPLGPKNALINIKGYSQRRYKIRIL